MVKILFNHIQHHIHFVQFPCESDKSSLRLVCHCLFVPNEWTHNNGKNPNQQHSPVSLLQHCSVSLWWSPFSSTSLCSRLPQDSRFAPLSSAGEGGKLPSREWLKWKDMSTNGFGCEVIRESALVVSSPSECRPPAPPDQLENTVCNNGTKR